MPIGAALEDQLCCPRTSPSRSSLAIGANDVAQRQHEIYRVVRTLSGEPANPQNTQQAIALQEGLDPYAGVALAREGRPRASSCFPEGLRARSRTINPVGQVVVRAASPADASFLP